MADSSANNGDHEQATRPVLCARGCGFYGNPITENMCSKCYRDTHTQQPIKPASLPTSPLKVSMASPQPRPSSLSASPIASSPLPLEEVKLPEAASPSK